MIYLSRLILTPRNRQVQREIEQPYQLHRTLLSAFSEGQVKVDRRNNDAAGVLYRVDLQDDTIAVIVQSKSAPNWEQLNSKTDARGCSYLSKPADSKRLDLHLEAGQLLAFRLRANPTKRLGKSAEHDTGKRVGLYSERQQLDWLKRKAAQNGFRVLRSLVSGDTKICNKDAIRRNSQVHSLEMLSVQFDGILQVADPDMLIQAVQSGIGSGKAFGFGLLSLAPAR